MKLHEIVEIVDHPCYIGVQYHPELKSKPFAPHPLFRDFVKAALVFAICIKEINPSCILAPPLAEVQMKAQFFSIA